jgi:hypothetical protein
VISFVIITLPQLSNAVWGLFSSEPLFPWLHRWAMGAMIPRFSPYWVTVPVGLAMFGITVYQVNRMNAFSLEYSWGLALDNISLATMIV